jgi:hypothetical protein
MKPRKHIHVKYCWQTYFKSIGTLSQTFKNYIHNNRDSRSISKRKQSGQLEIWPLNQHFYLHLWTKIKCFWNFVTVACHSSQLRLIPYLHQRPIFFKANSIHSSIVAISELIRGAQCLIEVIRSSGEEMWRVDAYQIPYYSRGIEEAKRTHPIFADWVACKWCVPSASDVFLSKNDSSGGKTSEASEGVEYDFYFTEYDFYPLWSRILIITHCTNKLI